MKVVCLLLLCLQLAACDILWVTGGFSSVSSFHNATVVRHNGYYFDDEFHVEIRSGEVYAMCRSKYEIYLGGDFVANTAQGEKEAFFAKTNTRYTSQIEKHFPVVKSFIPGYSNSYLESYSYPWSSNGNDESHFVPHASHSGGGGGDDGYYPAYAGYGYGYTYGSAYTGYSSGGGYDDDDDDGGGYSGDGGSSSGWSSGGGDDDDDGGGGGDDDDDDDDGLVNWGYVPSKGFMKDGVYHDYELKDNSTIPPYQKDNNVDGPVYDLFCTSEFVVVGGSFSTAGGLDSPNIAIWSSKRQSWLDLTDNGNPDGPVYAVAGFGYTTYIGGSFSTIGNLSASSLAYLSEDEWFSFDTINITGTVYDIVVSKSTYGVMVAGDFFVTDFNSTEILVSNFIVIDMADESVVNKNGADGIIRKLFIDSHTKTIYAGGNFGTPGLDEVRRYDTDNDVFVPIDNIFFVGEVRSINSYNSGKTLAVGGTFTSVLVNNVTYNHSYLVFYENKEWSSPGEINGPVYTMLSQHTHKDLVVGFVIVGFIITGICGISILFRLKPKRRSEKLRHTRDDRIINKAEHNHEVFKKIHLNVGWIFVPFIVGVIGSILLQIDLLHFTYKSLEDFAIGDINRKWSPENDKSYGFALSLPLFVVPLMAAIWFIAHIMLRKEYTVARRFHYSYQFKIFSYIGIFFSYLIWLGLFLFFYLAPLPDTLMNNPIYLALIIGVVQEIASSVLLARNHSFRKNGDIAMFLIHNTSFYIISRLLMASLNPVSPAILSSLSVFVPLFSYVFHLFRIAGNAFLSSRSQYETIAGVDEIGEEPMSVARLLFSFRGANTFNAYFRIVSLNKQLFMRVVDYCLLTGGHPIAAIVTVALSLFDFVFLLFESEARQMMGGFLHQVLIVNTALAFLSSPLSPATFMSHRVYIFNSSIFPIMLIVTIGSIYFILPTKKASKIGVMFLIPYWLFSLFGFILSWHSAASWTVFIPIFSFLSVGVIYTFFLFFVCVVMLRG